MPQLNGRRVIGLIVRHETPVGPRSEIVLDGIRPTPDRFKVFPLVFIIKYGSTLPGTLHAPGGAGVPTAFRIGIVLFRYGVEPGVLAHLDISSAPAAIIGRLQVAKPGVDGMQESRRIALGPEITVFEAPIPPPWAL